ncbi:hypothetical protein [Ruegeria sp. 6PALISEP08]|uniref:hypothetical protein n=1 Tax=Ruegeria sp. 6PALISEP08 TaxID=1225660 RepID=UPI00067F2418|nr:hypothetical protein [Ruegeria sp. 6PALISEP08]
MTTNSKKLASPFNLDDFLVPVEEFEAAQTDGYFEVSIGKPKRFEYFRAHPVWQFIGRIFEIDGDNGLDKERYLLAQHLMPEETEITDDEARLVLLRLLVTISGKVYLLPTFPTSDNEWHKSAIRAVKSGEEAWTRMSSMRAEGRYLVKEAEDQQALGEVKWPDQVDQGREGMMELLQRGFGTDGIITNADHPAVRRHKGLAR